MKKAIIFYSIWLLLGLLRSIPFCPASGQSIDTIIMSSHSIDWGESQIGSLLKECKESFKVSDCPYELAGETNFILKALADDLECPSLLEIQGIISTRMLFNNSYSDCVTIQEWHFQDDLKAEVVFNSLQNVDSVAIYYFPPQNWLWYLSGNKIFFVYSENFSRESLTMARVLNFIKQLPRNSKDN